MAGPRDKERGLRSETRVRVGLDFPQFHGTNRERDAGSVPPEEFVSLINAESDGKRITERAGLAKTVAAMFSGGALKGVWDLESDLESASSPVPPDPGPVAGDRYFYLGTAYTGWDAASGVLTGITLNFVEDALPRFDASFGSLVLLVVADQITVQATNVPGFNEPTRSGEVWSVSPGHTSTAATLFAAAIGNDKNVGACFSEDHTKFYVLKEVYTSGAFTNVQEFRLCTYNSSGTLVANDLVTNTLTSPLNSSPYFWRMAEVGGKLWCIRIHDGTATLFGESDPDVMGFTRTGGVWSVTHTAIPASVGDSGLDVRTMAVFGGDLYVGAHEFNTLEKRLYKSAGGTGAFTLVHTMSGTGAFDPYTTFNLASIGATLYYLYTSHTATDEQLLGTLTGGVYTDAVANLSAQGSAVIGSTSISGLFAHSGALLTNCFGFAMISSVADPITFTDAHTHIEAPQTDVSGNACGPVTA